MSFSLNYPLGRPSIRIVKSEGLINYYSDTYFVFFYLLKKKY